MWKACECMSRVKHAHKQYIMSDANIMRFWDASCGCKHQVETMGTERDWRLGVEVGLG